MAILAVKPRIASIETLPYGTDSLQQVDVYHPVVKSNRRALLWFHGGAFEYGTKSDFLADVPVVAKLVNQGWTIVVANYRFGHITDRADTAEPISLSDARSALSWLVASSPYLGVRSDRIVVGGESAGGTLAALLATLGTGAPKPHAWLAIDGPMDLAEMAQRSTPVLLGVGTPSRAVSAFLSCPYDFAERSSLCDVDRVDQYSPIEYLDADDPPGYLISGGRDEVVPPALHGIAMDQRATEVGAAIALDVVDSGDASMQTHTMSQWGANYTALVAWLKAASR